jgi:hypothetical protein
MKDYKPNEIYMTQWIDLLIYLAQKLEVKATEQPFDFGFNETLTELIDNNQYVLEKTMNHDRIKEFVNVFLKTRGLSSLKILQALIIVDGKVYLKN